MKFIIESNDEILIDIANYIESIDTAMICAPDEIPEEQFGDYLKLLQYLVKANNCLVIADAIAHTLWGD